MSTVLYIRSPEPVWRIIINHYEQLYANKLDNLEETDKVLETHNLPRLNHKEIRYLNEPKQLKIQKLTRCDGGHL